MDKSLLFFKDIIKFYLVCNIFIVFEIIFWFWNMITAFLNFSINLKNDFSLGYFGGLVFYVVESLELFSFRYVMFFRKCFRIVIYDF